MRKGVAVIGTATIIVDRDIASLLQCRASMRLEHHRWERAMHAATAACPGVPSAEVRNLSSRRPVEIPVDARWVAETPQSNTDARHAGVVVTNCAAADRDQTSDDYDGGHALHDRSIAFIDNDARAVMPAARPGVRCRVVLARVDPTADAKTGTPGNARLTIRRRGTRCSGC
jgi:hypothetical protein